VICFVINRSIQPSIDCVVVSTFEILKGGVVDCLREPCAVVGCGRGEGDADAKVSAKTIVEAGTLAEGTPDRINIEESGTFAVGFDVTSILGL